MKVMILLASMLLAASTITVGQAKGTTHEWAGVWEITDPSKPGGMVTLADDSGSLQGTITFNVKDRDTGKRIAIEVRSLVNPHIEGDAVVFQVRGILKPHLQGETDTDTAADTELAKMKLEPAGAGKASMVCANCGNTAPIAMAKEQ